ETKNNKDGTRSFHWKIDQPHASYLTSVIVGEYTPIVSDYQGIPIISNVYPSEAAEGRVTTTRLTGMVKFFSEKTGVKYPDAKYFQAMWDEYKLGRDDFLYFDVKSNQDAYFAAWKAGNRRPIVTKNYDNPDAVFDTYAYPRGGAVLHMLRKSLGEESWWRAISYYLKKYANQPVETEQFRIAIEESTGQSMDLFFDEWLYKMGHPVFEVTQHYDEA